MEDRGTTDKQLNFRVYRVDIIVLSRLLLLPPSPILFYDASLIKVFFLAKDLSATTLPRPKLFKRRRTFISSPTSTFSILIFFQRQPRFLPRDLYLFTTSQLYKHESGFMEFRKKRTRLTRSKFSISRIIINFVINFVKVEISCSKATWMDPRNRLLFKI